MNETLILEIIAVAMTVAVTSFSAAILILRDGPRRDQALILAAFLFLYDLIKIDDLAHALDLYVFAPALAIIVFPTMMLLGPTIHRYARSMTTNTPRSASRRDAWILGGPLIALVIASQFLFLDGTDKLALLSRGEVDPNLREWAVFNCELLFALFLVFSVGYLVAAFRLFLRHTRRVRDLFSNIEDKALDWLRWVLLILAAAWSWYVIGEIWALEGGRPGWYNLTTVYFEFAWISAIALFGILQRPVFETLQAEEAFAPNEAGRYARSALSEERMARIAGNLDFAMTRNNLYEDSTLSLRALSDRLGVSENHLSQTLNKKLGVNFFDYVNAARVAEARRRLEATDDSIVTIAHDVGFNSRSTFNVAFKKHAGSTPSLYRASAKAGADPIAAPS